MADQQLTPENLESYSVEAISNYGRAIDEFCDVLVGIKSEDANIAVFNSIYITIDGKKRRLGDIANIESPEDPLKIEVMVYSRDNFSFNLDPFEIDSLDNYTGKGLWFSGTLHSAGIFPIFKDTLKLQEDYSLGLNSTTPDNGFPIYGGKGRYYQSITLNNKGKGTTLIDIKSL